jgi:hypothetical protein
MSAPRGFPGLYAWLALLGTSLASVVLGMVVTFHLADRAVKAEQAAREQAQRSQAQQAEVGRQAACEMITAQDDVYRETPPITAAGKNAAQAWHDLSIEFKCA